MKKETNITEKPYSKCLTCHHRLAKRCDGPRTAPMELDKWCEYMRDMKVANRLTNAYIAEKSGVSVKTIERLMALNCDQDIMRETARKIENAIIGSNNQYPCYLAYEETHPDNAQQLALALSNLERALLDNQELKTTVDRLRRDVDYLRLENDRKARIIDKFLDS